MRPWWIALALGCWACDHGLGPGPEGMTGIAGRLSFAGEWPADVGQVAVAVYEEMPRSVADLFELSGWDTGVEIGSPTYEYFVPIERDGTYRWVVVAWRRSEGFWDFRSLLGCYHAAGDTLPTPVTVLLGQVTGGIDIQVDLRVLRGEEVPGNNICQRGLPPELASLDSGG